MTSIEIRVSGPPDRRSSRASAAPRSGHPRSALADGTDERGIDGHCLRLIGSQAVLIGAYCDGTLRAGLEIIPDRTAREAEAIFTAETGFCTGAIARMLIARMFDEARRYRLTRSPCAASMTSICSTGSPKRMSWTSTPGSPLRLCFAPAIAGGVRRRVSA